MLSTLAWREDDLHCFQYNLITGVEKSAPEPVILKHCPFPFISSTIFAKYCLRVKYIKAEFLPYMYVCMGPTIISLLTL